MHVTAAVVLAVLTSVANAASATLQWQATADAPAERRGLGLVAYLFGRRDYLLAVGALTVSFLLQAAALHEGDLALVQPLLVLELPFTLILAAAWLGVGLDLREVIGAVAIGAGLALFLGAGAPHGGRDGLPADAWLATAAVTVTVVAVLLVAAVGRAPVHRAVLLSAASGVEFSITALLVKAVTDRTGSGLVHLFAGWPLYAMVAAGVLAVLLQQQGFRAGPIAAAKPSTTVAATLGSVLIAVVVLREELRGGLLVLPEVAGIALLVAGVVELSRSPLIAEPPERAGVVDLRSDVTTEPAAGQAPGGAPRAVDPSPARCVPPR